MADITALVGLARIWGQKENTVFRNISQVMQGFDDMDLAKLLGEWAAEFCSKPLKGDPNAMEAFFNAKLNALCEECAEQKPEQTETKEEALKKVLLVERDYKGEYERFALTVDEFRKEYPATYAEFGPFDEVVNTFQKDGTTLSSFECSNSDTLQPMVHIWFCHTTIGSEVWTTFFSNMEWGLPQSDIDNGNLATIRLDLFGSLFEHITPYTYVRANTHTGADEDHLLLEWGKEKCRRDGKSCAMETAKYHVVETWDRELQSVTECLSLGEAISAANILLNEHLKDVGHGDEVEVEYDETSDWCRASAEKLNAWCNYQGEWDAYIKKYE